MITRILKLAAVLIVGTSTMALADSHGASSVAGGLPALEARVIALEALVGGEPPVTEVFADCTVGDSINGALSLATPGHPFAVNIIGICIEDVLITLNDVTLNGVAGATVNGTIRVDAARRVVIRNLTVTGTGDGIVGTDGADFDVQDTAITSNDNQGLVVSNNSHVNAFNVVVTDTFGLGVLVLLNSSMNLSNSTVSNNGAGGIDVSRSASAFLNDVIIDGNEGNGLFVNRHAVVESNGGLTVTGNSAFGVAVGNNSHIALFNSTVESNQNGILLFQASSAEIGQFGSVIVRGNIGSGISISDSRLEGGNLTVEDHTFGGITIGNGNLSLSSSTVSNNGGPDVLAFFGSRLNLNGNTIGSLNCDGTVLSAGDLVCP